MSRRYFFIITGILLVGPLFWGCSPYTQQVVPFKMPGSFSNMTQLAGIQIGARSYSDPNEAQKAFGFDIRGAGLLPVQVVIDHKGTSPLEINSSQTFLVDYQNNLWPVLDKRLAYERVARYSEMAEIGAGAAKHGFLGAAAGATAGGVSAYESNRVNQDISRDLRNKSLESRPIRPLEIVHGFIFFPGEASSAKELRLQFKESGTNRFLNIALPL
ncbi:MAG: hypothetical protein HY787_20195 [Deltaproteobacteria bacterium]|nr:hypothetical protein [Deltaproteobacteria bacterium]